MDDASPSIVYRLSSKARALLRFAARIGCGFAALLGKLPHDHIDGLVDRKIRAIEPVADLWRLLAQHAVEGLDCVVAGVAGLAAVVLARCNYRGAWAQNDNREWVIAKGCERLGQRASDNDILIHHGKAGPEVAFCSIGGQLVAQCELPLRLG